MKWLPEPQSKSSLYPSESRMRLRPCSFISALLAEGEFSISTVILSKVPPPYFVSDNYIKSVYGKFNRKKLVCVTFDAMEIHSRLVQITYLQKKKARLWVCRARLLGFNGVHEPHDVVYRETHIAFCAWPCFLVWNSHSVD